LLKLPSLAGAAGGPRPSWAPAASGLYPGVSRSTWEADRADHAGGKTGKNKERRDSSGKDKDKAKAKAKDK
jgi:hypothetical protein